MKTISREEAYSKISINIFSKLTDYEKIEYSLEWIGISKDDPEFFLLTDQMKIDLENINLDSIDPKSELCEKLCLIGICNSLVGTTNQFLERMLKAKFVVKGDIEVMCVCECCGYKSLADNSAYSICPVCGWESVGKINENEYSDVNRSSLKDAKLKFELQGHLYKKLSIDEQIENKIKYDHSVLIKP